MSPAIQASSGVRRAIAGLCAIMRGNTHARPIGAVVAVLIGTFMTSFFTRDFGIALADLRGVFGLSVDEGSWLNTVTTAPQLLVAPAIPLVVLVVGARRLLLVTGAAFMVVSFATPFAIGPAAVFVMHGLLGLLLGCFVPATLATVFANLSPRYWLMALGIYTARLTLALHLGVPQAAFFVEHGDWPWIYWQATLSAAALVLLVLASIPDRSPNRSLWQRTSKGEVAMFCVGLTLLYVGLDQGNRLDWLASGIVTGCLGGGVVLVAAAIAWQYVSPVPFAHPEALKRRNIAIPLIIVMFYGMMSAATSLVIPAFLGAIANLKAEQIGSALLPVSIVQIVAVPVSVWVARRVDLRLMLTIGLVAILLGCWLGTGITHDWRGEDFVPLGIAMGVGNALTFLSLVSLVIANAQRSELLFIVAYIQIPRVVGPELAGAVINTIVRKGEGIHSFLLGGYLDRVRIGALDVFDRLSHGAVTALVRREAYVLAYADAYQFCFWITLACLGLAIFLRPTPPNALTAPLDNR